MVRIWFKLVKEALDASHSFAVLCTRLSRENVNESPTQLIIDIHIACMCSWQFECNYLGDQERKKQSLAYTHVLVRNYVLWPGWTRCVRSNESI